MLQALETTLLRRMNLITSHRRLRGLMLALIVGVALLGASIDTARADGPGGHGKGFPAHGEVAFALPTLTNENRTAELTLDTPVGPVTLSAKMSAVSTPQVAQGGAMSLTDYGPKSCEAWYTIPATAAFGVMNSFTYDYNSVTWMSSATYDEWWVPPGHVDDEQTWTTWWSGIQYAYADGKANYVEGVAPLEIILGTFHVWIQEDAWGNCTPHGTYGW